MKKIISLKYPDICYECHNVVGKGTMVMWLGKKQGIYCFPSCWMKQSRLTK